MPFALSAQASSKFLNTHCLDTILRSDLLLVLCSPTRLPLSAFIIEDMMELVHAHASYRFILSDEEEEKPRLLVFTFTPSL